MIPVKQAPIPVLGVCFVGILEELRIRRVRCDAMALRYHGLVNVLTQMDADEGSFEITIVYDEFL